MRWWPALEGSRVVATGGGIAVTNILLTRAPAFGGFPPEAAGARLLHYGLPLPPSRAKKHATGTGSRFTEMRSFLSPVSGSEGNRPRLATCDGTPEYTYKAAYNEAGALLAELGGGV